MLFSHAPLENDLHILQRLPKKANGNFFSPQFFFIHGQVVSQAYQTLYNAKLRPSSKLNKISQGMRYWALRFFFSCPNEIE